MSLGYAVSTRGGSHHDTRPFYAGTHPDPGFETRPEYVQKNNYFTTLGDSLSICRFIAEGMLDRYYALRGWSPDGVPTPEKLSELGLP